MEATQEFSTGERARKAVVTLYALLAMGWSLRGVSLGSPLSEAMISSLVGLLAWMLIEYLSHRYLLHLPADSRVPRFLLELTSGIHRMHHQYPNHPQHTLIPWKLTLPTGLGLFLLAHLVCPSPRIAAWICGSFTTSYLLYEWMHFQAHHGRPSYQLGKWLKSYHAQHHFVDSRSRFGVTSPVWDWLFGSAKKRRSGASARSLAGILCGALTLSYPSSGAVWASTQLEVFGHRGARASWPESSLAAFDGAVRAGVDFLETDLQLTRDGRFVLNHDGFVDPSRCLAGDGSVLWARIPIRHLTLAEVKTYDCGSLSQKAFPLQRRVPGSRILSLEEFLIWFSSEQSRAGQDQPKGLLFEIKTPLSALGENPKPGPLPSPSGYARLLAEEFARVSFHGPTQVMIQAADFRYSWAATRALRAQGVPVRSDSVFPKAEWVSATGVRLLHLFGLKVIPWTANTPSEWNRLLGLGVDGIITDDPAGLLRVLGRGRQ